MSLRKLRTAAVIVVVATVSFAAGAGAQPRYPALDQAEGSLQAALSELRAGRDVFGGHKGKAERLIERAIGELHAARDWAASRGR